MKKACSLILVLLLAMQLTACGGSEKEIRGEVTPAAASEATTAETAAPAETEAVSEPQVQERIDPDAERELALGSSDGSTYTSTFLGLKCTLGGDWVFYSDEEILEMNQLAQDMMDEEMAERIRSASTLQDMYAVNTETGETVNITISNTGSLFGTILSADAYANAALPQLTPAMQSIGLENVTVEKSSTVFVGKTETTILIAGDFDGTPFYETMVVLKRGSYVACITAASYVENTTGLTLNAFDLL